MTRDRKQNISTDPGCVVSFDTVRYPYEMNENQFKCVIAVLLCSFIATYTTLTSTTTLRYIRDAFDIDYSYGVWLSQAVPIASISFYLVVTDFSNRRGKRNMMMLGLIITAITSLVASFSVNFWMLMLSRMLTGIGVAMIFASATSIITDNTEEKYRREVIGLNYVATSIGAIVGPISSFLLCETFNWQSMFLSVVPICILTLFLLRKCENVISKTKIEEIPVLPHVLYIAGTVLLLFGLFKPDTEISLIVIGAILVVLFFVSHHFSKVKIVDASAFIKNKIVVTTVIIAFLFYVINYSIDNTIIQYLQLFDGKIVIIGAITVGVFTSLLRGLKPLMQCICTPFIGRMLRNRSKGLATMIGSLILLLCLLLLLIFTEYEVPVMFVVVFLLISVATSFFVPENTTIMLSSVDKKDRNASSSIYNIVHTIGQIFGVMILIRLLSTFDQTTPSTYLGSCDTLFIILFIACFILTLIIIHRYIQLKKSQ